MRCSARYAQGFTLIELSIVMFISLLAFAAIGSRIGSGNPTAQMQATARDLVSALRYARGEALLLRKPVSLAVDLRDNRYQISSQDKFYDFPEEMAVDLVIAQDEFETGDIGHIRFFPDGSSTGGRITLEWSGQTRQIDVNWITGAVTLAGEAD